MTGSPGQCRHCGSEFSLISTYFTYGGARFCSKDCLIVFGQNYKNSKRGMEEIESEHEVHNEDSDISLSDTPTTSKPSSEVSTRSRRAGYRLEAEFECFEIDEYLWLDATPIADAGEVKFRSDRCPECGAIHWTGCAL